MAMDPSKAPPIPEGYQQPVVYDYGGTFDHEVYQNALYMDAAAKTPLAQQQEQFMTQMGVPSNRMYHELMPQQQPQHIHHHLQQQQQQQSQQQQYR